MRLVATLLVVALMTFASLVRAHTGHEHSPPVADRIERQETQQPVAKPAVEPPAIARASRPCPDTPVHLCGCGNLVPCSSGKPAAISAAPFTLQPVLRGARVVLVRARLTRNAAAFSRARPRAPPPAS